MKLRFAGNTNQYFTFGKSYTVLDYIENGYVVADDDNAVHYISGEYSINFEKIQED